MRNKYLESIYCDRKQIQSAIKECAKWANTTLKSNRSHVVVLGVLNGSIAFFGQVMTLLRFNMVTDFIRVESYLGTDTVIQEPKLTLSVQERTKKDIKNKTVLVVDDILGSGKSAKLIYDEILSMGAKEVVFMFMLDQDKPKIEGLNFQYHAGIKVPDKFLVGYGLDYQGKYRNLDCVGLLKEKYIKK